MPDRELVEIMERETALVANALREAVDRPTLATVYVLIRPPEPDLEAA